MSQLSAQARDPLAPSLRTAHPRRAHARARARARAAAATLCFGASHKSQWLCSFSKALVLVLAVFAGSVRSALPMETLAPDQRRMLALELARGGQGKQGPKS